MQLRFRFHSDGRRRDFTWVGQKRSLAVLIIACKTRHLGLFRTLAAVAPSASDVWQMGEDDPVPKCAVMLNFATRYIRA